MRILSLRLIVALIVGVTLVSLASSWYQVQAEKDALRATWNGKPKHLAKASPEMQSPTCRRETRPGSRKWFAVSATGIMCWESACTT
jgi:hypothetical protein